jgi:hypothetical protein
MLISLLFGQVDNGTARSRQAGLELGCKCTAFEKDRRALCMDIFTCSTNDTVLALEIGSREMILICITLVIRKLASPTTLCPMELLPCLFTNLPPKTAAFLARVKAL